MEKGCCRHNAGNDSKNSECHIDTEFFPELNDLQNISKLGNSGSQPRNCKRDLISLLAPYGFEVSEHKIPLKCGKGLKKIALFSQPFLLPHVFLSSLWNNFRNSFSTLVCPDADALEHFWDAMDNHPALVDHAMKTRPNWKRRAIPLVLHGDAVPVTGIGRSWSRSMLNISVSSVLGRGPAMDTQFLIFWLMTALFVDDRLTMLMAWKIICRSLDILYQVEF